VIITEKNWKQIREFWGTASHATASPNMPYCVFATVNEDGTPRIAPYSSLILGEKKNGFYFDEFSPHLSKNLDRNNKICILLLKNNRWFWVKAVLFGKFKHAPGIRLMGTVGEKREATLLELNTFKRPLNKLRFFKGYKPLWGVMKHGREIYFESFELVKCGSMEYLESILS
jgi:uncharacterized pyridoxamine 5'-phosphate oxidase family protein